MTKLNEGLNKEILMQYLGTCFDTLRTMRDLTIQQSMALATS